MTRKGGTLRCHAARRVLGGALAASILILAAVRTHGETLDAARYAERLDRIAGALRDGASKDASTLASALLQDRVQGSAGETRTDRTVLGPIADGRDPEAVAAAAARLEILIRELRRPAPDAAPRAIDAPLLERLRGEEAVKEESGGDVPGLNVKPELGSLEQFADHIVRVSEKIQSVIRDIVRWLGRSFGIVVESGTGEAGVSWVAIILVVLVAGVLGAALVYLRWRPADVPASSSSGMSRNASRDADPLSRDVGEWERYAGQLAAEGRLREAIRAWYHAVLVALYRAGFLHYWKGRTNWEYVSALSPQAAWRAAFIDVTREFEREWYGGRESTTDALAVCITGARQVLEATRAERRAP
jgi:hypothetical protein